MKILRSKAFLALIAILVVIAVLFVGLGSVFRPSAANANVPTTTITRGDLESTVLSSGALQPASDVNLSFGTAGTVQQFFVKAGQQVRSGDKLAVLDTRDLQLAVDQATAGLHSAQAKLDQVK